MVNNIKEEMKRYNHLNTEIEGVYHEAAWRLGLSDSATFILYTICEHDGSCLLGDIARLSGISKQTINFELRKLENDGIVFLEPAGGRMKKVCFTEKGKRMVKDTVCRLIEIENNIFSSWKAQERELYLELTQRHLALHCCC
ncbi:helix-turn-helix domain-containing protein [Lachnospiraceae bacterium 46-15]